MLTLLMIRDGLQNSMILVDQDMLDLESDEGAVFYRMRPAIDKKYRASLWKHSSRADSWEEVIYRGQRVTNASLQKWLQSEIEPFLGLPTEKGAKERFVMIPMD